MHYRNMSVFKSMTGSRVPSPGFVEPAAQGFQTTVPRSGTGNPGPRTQDSGLRTRRPLLLYSEAPALCLTLRVLCPLHVQSGFSLFSSSLRASRSRRAPSGVLLYSPRIGSTNRMTALLSAAAGRMWTPTCPWLTDRRAWNGRAMSSTTSSRCPWKWAMNSAPRAGVSRYCFPTAA